MCSVPFSYTVVSSIIITSQTVAMFYALSLKPMDPNQFTFFFPFMDLTFDVKSKNYLPIARLKCFFPTWILNKLFCRCVGHFESVFMVWGVWFR